MMITFYTICPICGKETHVGVDSDDFKAWQNGALIQDVMGYLTPKERETLISGICPICWDKIFSSEEEEEEEKEEEDYGLEEFDYDFRDEIGFNPYMGCYDGDC